MTLGVLGSMVWDRIEHPEAPVVERWGGIAYSLAAAAAALPDGWRIRPLIRIGDDLADAALDFLRGIPGLDLEPGILRTPHPNNRVHLRYRDRHHRLESLTGGVPPWTPEELLPRLDGVDHLFVNLISGFELELDTARRLRGVIPGLLYADLHSLLLDRTGEGHRRPRRLEDGREWAACFDYVQANEEELALAAGDEEPWTFARAVAGDGPTRAVLVTRGPRGAEWVARSAATPGTAGDPVVAGKAPLEDGWPGSDPTGCGDVWGATCFLRLVRGDTLEQAVRAANRAAARNVSHRGADGLYQHLKGQS